MEKIKWQERFNVDFDQIDTQHISFVELINTLIDDIESNEKIIEGLCEELIAFSRYHFTSEQNLMRRNNYPAYDKHRKEHNLLLTTLNEKVVGVQFKKENVIELIEFLLQWFAEHTNSEDKALGKYLNSRKRG